MNKRRLLKLADLLKTNAKNRKGAKFDLNRWGKVSSDDDLMSCGTTACAAGLAAISGAFKRSGLGYKLVPRFDSGYNITITLNGKCRDHSGRVGSYHSIQEFFALSEDEADFIFLKTSYEWSTKGAEGERAVAKRIRDFVSGKVAP